MRHPGERQVSIGTMRTALRRILDEDWIVILGSGIALGYTLLNVAEAFGYAVITALATHDGDAALVTDTGPLSFAVSGHAFVLGQLVQTLIAFAVVLGVVAFAVSRLQRASEPPSTDATS
jgi:hypothetical protein